MVASVRFRSGRLLDRLRLVALDADRTPQRVARRVAAQPSAGVLCCVYRRQHVDRVGALALEARGAGLTARLWALDGAAPSLESWTVGKGPGLRQGLLNRLIPDDADGWVVLADDDVVLPEGGLARLLTIATRIGLDVAQPGHDGASQASTPFVRARRGVGARRTGFVEIGPVVALGPAARSSLLPLDESLGMGWGQDYLWARAFETDSLAAGIVDAVRMRHLPQPTRQYDYAEAARQRDDGLARAGFRSYHEPMVTYRTWQPGDLA